MRPVERQGHDNRTFRIGDELSARVPSHPAYVEHGVYEFECLPRIARGLSLPIPEPVARAEAGAEIEWPWLVLRWIAGETGSLEALADPVAFARDLAGFLGELHAISAGSGPAPGQHNFFRGGPLATYDAGDAFDHTAAAGFIKLWGLPVEIAASGTPAATTPATARS